jgi:hypothetical protein
VPYVYLGRKGVFFFIWINAFADCILFYFSQSYIAKFRLINVVSKRSFGLEITGLFVQWMKVYSEVV